MISASHNPFEDNGIKVFSGGGEKFTEPIEREVEAMVADPTWSAREGTAVAVEHRDLLGAYLTHLQGVFPESSNRERLRLAIDCGNGATTPVAPQLFGQLGYDLVVIGNHPDGRNINLNCGSTHPERLQETVVAQGCRLGVAFDGDGDRAIFVDENAGVVNGDAVLLMCARQLRREGRLKNNAVVATVMSNLGLHLAMREHGVTLRTTAVGDRYVLEELRSGGYTLGGEQSGHVLLPAHATTGDGVLTALRLMARVVGSGSTLAELSGVMRRLPQVLVNVRVTDKAAVAVAGSVADAVADVQRELGEAGRVLLRPSGTEQLVRVMVEAPTHDLAQAAASRLATVVASVR
jgi:phosphoglucosamine mutase